MSSSSNAHQDEGHRQERAGLAEPVPLTHRVNVEPSILRGMTVTEAKVIAAISIPACLFLGAVLLLLTGWWQLLMCLAGSARLRPCGLARPSCRNSSAAGPTATTHRPCTSGFLARALPKATS